MSLVDELGARPQWRSLELRTIHQLVRWWGVWCAADLHPSLRRSSRNLVSAANWQFPTQGRQDQLSTTGARVTAGGAGAGRSGRTMLAPRALVGSLDEGRRYATTDESSNTSRLLGSGQSCLDSQRDNMCYQFP